MPIDTATGRPPRGFTLIEVLVVLAILVLLFAITFPAVMAARRAAQITAIKAEIDLLHMALMNYRSEYGSFPPCFSGTAATDPAAKHVARLFPRCANPVPQVLAISGTDVVVSGTGVTPAKALVVWLRGYTNDPASPALPETERRPLFDFDLARVGTATRTYAPNGLTRSPYVYIDSGGGRYATSYVIGSGTYQAVAGFQPGGFQILCAGLDQAWNTPDDMSNFWKTTRGDHVEAPP